MLKPVTFLKFRSAQSGFSLLELLLAISLSAILFAGAARIFDDWATAAVDRKVSREMQNLQNAAREYVRLNINQIIADDIPNVGNTSEINIADLVANGFLPDGYNALNAYKQQLRVFIRHADDDSINGNVIEVLSFSEGPRVSDSRLFSAASNGDKSVGIISNINLSATCCNGNIQSLSGDWVVPIANYVAPTAITAPNADGGYMAAYDVVSVNQETANSYLYRSKMRQIPQLNRMDTNLLMAGNDIVNAATIVADNFRVDGNANFDGELRDGTPAPYVISVLDDMQVNQNVIVNSSGQDNKGNVIVNGDDAFGADFTVRNQLNMSSADTALGTVSASTVSTQNLTMGTTSDFNDVSVNNQDVEGQNILNRATRYNDQIITNELQAASAQFVGEIHAGSATIAETVITDPNGLVFSGGQPLEVTRTVDINGNSSSKQLTGTIAVEITNMITCSSGCP